MGKAEAIFVESESDFEIIKKESSESDLEVSEELAEERIYGSVLEPNQHL